MGHLGRHLPQWTEDDSVEPPARDVFAVQRVALKALEGVAMMVELSHAYAAYLVPRHHEC